MLSMGMQGEAVYKGFPVIEEGEEYWWVQLHLYKDKEDDHKRDETLNVHLYKDKENNHKR
jgi:hypothetical protein